MPEWRFAFSGISVNDIDAARRFYGEVLGLAVKDEMGGLRVTLPGGGDLWIYPKTDHEPATFTVLNLVVSGIDVAVDQLNAAGVDTRIYGEGEYGTDAKGIARGRSANRGPDIAWFRDPAGNVLAVVDPGD